MAVQLAAQLRPVGGTPWKTPRCVPRTVAWPAGLGNDVISRGELASDQHLVDVPADDVTRLVGHGQQGFAAGVRTGPAGTK